MIGDLQPVRQRIGSVAITPQDSFVWFEQSIEAFSYSRTPLI